MKELATEILELTATQEELVKRHDVISTLLDEKKEADLSTENMLLKIKLALLDNQDKVIGKTKLFEKVFTEITKRISHYDNMSTTDIWESKFNYLTYPSTTLNPKSLRKLAITSISKSHFFSPQDIKKLPTELQEDIHAENIVQEQLSKWK